MDLNAIVPKGAAPSVVASPVVPGSRTPKPQPVAESSKQDVVVLSNEKRVKATDTELVANSTRNISNGSRVYHDDAANRYIIQIVNENNEVIRQVPQEELLKSAERLREITGLIFDKSV